MIGDTPKPPRLKKAAGLMKVNFGLVLFSVFLSLFKHSLPESLAFNPIIDLMVALPIVILFVLSPIGVYHCWKSYQTKEGFPLLRNRYLFGHLFFIFLFVFLLIVVTKDITHVGME